MLSLTAAIVKKSSRLSGFLQSDYGFQTMQLNKWIVYHAIPC